MAPRRRSPVTAAFIAGVVAAFIVYFIQHTFFSHLHLPAPPAPHDGSAMHAVLAKPPPARAATPPKPPPTPPAPTAPRAAANPPDRRSCVDSSSWFHDDPKKDCAYLAVAATTKSWKHKCSWRDAGGVKGWAACPGACRKECRRTCAPRPSVRCAAARAPPPSASAPQHVLLEGLAARLGAPNVSMHRSLAAIAARRGNASLDAAARQRQLCGLLDGPTRRPPGSCGPRWFFVPDTRKDMPFVREEIAALGLCAYSKKKAPPDGSVDVFFGHDFPPWNRSWARPLSPAFADGAVVGGGVLPGASDLGAKQAMTELYRDCVDDVESGRRRAALCPRLGGRGLLVSFDVNGEEVVDWRHDRFESSKKARLRARDVPRLAKLRGEIQRFLHEREGLESSAWIVKPQSRLAAGLHQSRGMHLARLDHAADLASDGAFLAWIAKNMKRGECDDGSVLDVPHRKYCARRKVVFQNFVEDVSEIFGRKYDVRVWALVTSVDPLRVHVLRHGLTKIASTTRRSVANGTYGAVKPLEDDCAHIKLLMNPSCGVKSVAQFTAGMEPDGYPKSTASRAFTERATFGPRAYRGAASTRAGNEALLASTTWPRVEGLLTKVLLRSRDELRARGAEAAELEARTRGGGAPVAARTSPAAMLSPDFVLDRRGVPHLEEINHKGLIIGENGDDGGADIIFTDYGALRSLLQIAGVDDFPEAPAYADKLDAAICAFCGSRDGKPKCAADEVAAMARAVHEEAHAGPDWYRLYPPLTCHARDGTCAPPAPPRSKGGRGGEAASDWPDQFKLTEAHLAAFVESRLDKAVREFLEATDTSRIHGRVVVPGHGRWPPR